MLGNKKLVMWQSRAEKRLERSANMKRCRKATRHPHPHHQGHGCSLSNTGSGGVKTASTMAKGSQCYHQQQVKTEKNTPVQ